MKKFSLGPSIFEMETLQEFLDTFEINNKDLIFINRFTYADFFKNLTLPCHILFYEDYSLGEPSDEIVTKIIQDIKNLDIDRIIGIGGGSVLDTAKLLCIKNASSAEDIYEDRIPLVREKKLVLIPTTCGTGCEMTCVSVIDRPKLKAKIGKRIECNFADQAVLIPELLSKIPYTVFAYSSIDALIHAMEIYVNPTAGNFSKSYCKEAIQLILSNYKTMAKKGLDTRFALMERFLLSSAYAGIALSNDLCGAVHACAMQFGGAHHLSHGASNYQFLVPVFSVYAQQQPRGEIQLLAEIIQEALEIKTDLLGTFDALEELLNQIIPNKKLRDFGIAESELSGYVEKVYETQQRLLVVSYVQMTKEKFLDIYKKAY